MREPGVKRKTRGLFGKSAAERGRCFKTNVSLECRFSLSRSWPKKKKTLFSILPLSTPPFLTTLAPNLPSFFTKFAPQEAS